MYSPEASLRMVAPGSGFYGGTLYRPKYWWRPKKRSLLQNELVFSQKYVMTKKKKKVFVYQSVGFRSQKKKKQMVLTLNGDTRSGPPAPLSDATDTV